MANAVDGSEQDTQKQPADAQPGTNGTGQDADASRAAMLLGESRKAGYGALIRLAKVSPEAKQELQTLAKDEYIKDFLEKKFGDEFASVFNSSVEPDPQLSTISKTVSELAREREVSRLSALQSAKESLSLSQDEAQEFDDLVASLEGKKIAGSVVSYSQAIEKATKMMRPGQTVNSPKKADVSRRPEDQKKVDISIPEDRIQMISSFTGATKKEDFLPIAESFAKGEPYIIR